MTDGSVLHHVALCCHEKQSLSVFYEDVLNAKLVKTFLVSPELFVDIFDKQGSAEVFVYETDFVCFELFVSDCVGSCCCAHLCFGVADKQVFAEQCEKRSLPVKWVKKNGKSLLFVSDFSGNLFEIKEKK